MQVRIVDMDHKGNGIGKIDNKVIFIPKGITGDLVDIEIVKSHKKYDEGRVLEIIESSGDRIESLCPYYDVCGGCNISNLSYMKQLEYKKNKVVNIFKRYLDMNINPEIVGSDNRYEYRNKITYKCVNGKLGLVSIDNDLVLVDRCYLVSDRVNELYEIISKEDLSWVDKVIIKECDNGLILGVYGNVNIKDKIEDYVDSLVDKVRESCLSIYVNGICVCRNDFGYINIGNIRYRVSLDSFFQVNSENISRMYDVIVRYGDFCKNDRVIDLYCGVGSISLYVSKYVDTVLGIEIVEDAIRDAKENAKLNNINNVEFICGDVSKLIDDNVNGNKIIVDPPRVGLDNHTIDVLNEINVNRLIYVSCDVMTLVRDLKKLDKYEIKDVTLVDMFSQTHHCEVVVLLSKK